MQDPRKTGALVARLRRERNWTQLELADRLGVTPQAVSRWEVGSSFPDIGTLVRLAALFGVTADDVLAGEVGGRPAEGPTVRLGAVISELAGDRPERVAGMVRAGEVPLAAVVEAAPLTPPAQMGRLVGALADYPFSLEQLRDLAPFLGQETLDALVARAGGDPPLELVGALAPFVGEATLGRLVGRVASGELGLDYLRQLAPFLTRGQRGELLDVSGGLPPFDTIAALAPFLDDDQLDALVARAGADMTPELVSALAPFLSQEALTQLLDAGSDDMLRRLAPFLAPAALDGYVGRIATGELGHEQLRQVAPFLTSEQRGRLLADDPEQRALAILAPFLGAAERDAIVARVAGGALPMSAGLALAPFLGQDALLQLARIDPAQLTRLAPFFSQETLARALGLEITAA